QFLDDGGLCLAKLPTLSQLSKQERAAPAGVVIGMGEEPAAPVAYLRTAGGQLHCKPRRNHCTRPSCLVSNADRRSPSDPGMRVTSRLQASGGGTQLLCSGGRAERSGTHDKPASRPPSAGANWSACPLHRLEELRR